MNDQIQESDILAIALRHLDNVRADLVSGRALVTEIVSYKTPKDGAVKWSIAVTLTEGN